MGVIAGLLLLVALVLAAYAIVLRVRVQRQPDGPPAPYKPWQFGWGAFVVLVLAIVLAPSDDNSKKSDRTAADRPATTRSAPAAPTATTAAAPEQTLADAQERIDNDDFPGALTIASALGRDEERTVRRRIANHLARQVTTAVRSGDRGRARGLLGVADGYPTTSSLHAARVNYRAAVTRARQRAAARRAAAAERARERAAAREEARREREAQQESSGSGTTDPSQYAGMNCTEIGHPFQVTPGSDPEHDRDNDGVACESQ